MTLVRAIALGAALAGIALPPSSLAAQPRQLVVIASGWVVGVYYPIAGAMSRIAYNAPDLNIRAVVESSGASVANAQLLGAGDADLALMQNDIAYYAVRGSALPEFTGRPVTTVTGLFTLFSEPVHVVARRAAGVKSVRDLRGKRVILGPAASGTEQNALQILEAYGVRESDLGRALRVEAAAAAEQIREGQVDAAFFTTGLGSVVVLDTLVRGQATLVPIEHAQGQALRQKYPFYTPETIPTTAYKGLAGEVPTVAVRAMVVARSGLSEDLVYRFTRAIFDNLGQLHAADPAARGLTLPTALRGMPIALHPGAAKFFTERGVSPKEAP